MLRRPQCPPFFDIAVIGEASVVQTACIGAVHNTSDAVSRLVAFGALSSDFYDGAAEVAAHRRAWG